ncbi:nicotinate-nicotinamide nucleotide adenylyltransferase [Vibrio methylphosphonaticus]|uniref:nicotinate-nicotinamide nucleotide adenylyltransferase n=1 Tax=Vibrio methylphosphonaticus TaxID=2946866 RepID=UPI002029ED66|nr:nicotinate-nicotinamide nucleotide adenylyltransferase [Vibrio methylphosphonaticus]MCL9774134.1 nicotinate-nicotinamide nucleotide adenylyltransferase [Vibrio methylphosphonaticus]
MTKIAIFGSAFNPPSLGHQSVIQSLEHYDKVLLVPSISHAWGKTMLDYAKRCELVDLFIADMNQTNVERSCIEESLLEPNASVTTYAVLNAIQEQYPTAELTFVLGPDNLFSFGRFHNAKEIAERWSVLACPERVKVRSTQIREHLQQGLNVDHLTTTSVAKHLSLSPLY